MSGRSTHVKAEREGSLISVHERKYNKTYTSKVKEVRFEGGKSDEEHVLPRGARMEGPCNGVDQALPGDLSRSILSKPK